MAFPTESGDPKLCGGIWGFGIFDNGDEAKIEAAKTFATSSLLTPTRLAQAFWLPPTSPFARALATSTPATTL